MSSSQPSSHTDAQSADHAACQAAVQAIYDAAVEVMEDMSGLTSLMPPREAFEYRLGTAGHLYHREGITDFIRERDGYREENRVLSRALSLACKGDRDPSAMKDALIKQARVDLDQQDYMARRRGQG